MDYNELKEECINIYTELSFNSRWIRIAMFHLIGKTVIESNLPEGKLAQLAHAIGISPYDLATAVLLALKYPRLDDAPFDKTIAWDNVRRFLDETEERQKDKR